jgi:hypothetical protein
MNVSRSEKPLETLRPLRDESIPQGRLMMLPGCPNSALMLFVSSRQLRPFRHRHNRQQKNLSFRSTPVSDAL